MITPTPFHRIRPLAEYYAAPLPQLTGKVMMLSARVDKHLKKMSPVWE